MAILEIVQYPDLRLKRRANKVVDVKDPAIQQLIKNMLDTLASHEECAALAATQLAIDNPPSIIVVNGLEDFFEEKPFCLVNPKIIAAKGSKKITENEGCMSILPDAISAPVKRAYEIIISAEDRHGNCLNNIQVKDFAARCLQHEYDHLQGIIFLDHLSKKLRKKIDAKILEISASRKS